MSGGCVGCSSLDNTAGSVNLSSQQTIVHLASTHFVTLLCSHWSTLEVTLVLYGTQKNVRIQERKMATMTTRNALDTQ